MMKRMADKLGRKERSPSTVASLSSSVCVHSTTTQNSVETRASDAPHIVRPPSMYKLSDFQMERTLGTGSFGRVHLARSRHNGRHYAIKVLNKDRIVRLKQVSHCNSEKKLLQSVRHPFIVTLWGAFQDCSSLFLILDFVPGGELFSLLRRSNRFPDPVAKFYTAEVALALSHLHSLNCVYRDLKPENILLNMDGHIKITDFGFAKTVATTTYTLCGTPDYLAPEIVKQQRYNKSVDWYALGVLLFEMLSGLPPYHQAEDANPVLLYEKIKRGPSHIRWPNFNPKATDLILKLMEGDPTRRWGNLANGANDVFSHEYFFEVDWHKLLNREVTAPFIPKSSGEGDASAFDLYTEDRTTNYGGHAVDPYGPEFPDFQYTGE